jgi:EmrB/QacA subfamily drug resistance transporter
MNKQDGVVAPAAMGKAEIRVIMIGLMVAMFPGALDSTIIGPAMPTIGRELGDVGNLPWIVTAYLLVATAATPLYGKLSDIHGRRVMLLTAIGLFAIGSVLCALAPTMIMLAIARAVQALGGGGLVSLAMTVIGDVVAPKERPRYQVYTSVMWTTASLLGPVLGGYFAELWHWTLIFWINLPLCLVAYILTDSKLKRLPRHERPHKLDIAGAFLLVVASGLVQLTLSWGGSHYAWSSPQILSLGAASAVFVALFIWRLARAAEPLIPYRLLSNQIVLTGASSVGLTMAVFVALTVYTPIYFENVRGLSASQSGLALLPLMVCSTIGALAAGRVMVHLRRYKFVALTGLALASAALLPIFFFPHDLSLTTIEILLAIVSIGVGAVFPTTTVSIQNSVARHDLGTATGLITFMRNLGAAAGVAIFGATLGVIDLGARAEAGSNALADTFRWMFLIGAVGLLFALVILTFMEERALSSGKSGALG